METSVRVSLRRSFVLVLGFFSLIATTGATGCDKLSELWGDPPPPRPQPQRPPPNDHPDEPTPGIDVLAAPVTPLERATRKLRFPGKSSGHMGFHLDKLSQLYALAGAVEIPEWSDQGNGGARSVQDDDLRTSWSCRLGSDRACAIGIHFPIPAEVEVIRLFFANPTGSPATYPKQVRVHLDTGWAEAKLSNEGGPIYISLGEPTPTLNLSIELVERYQPAPIHLAEFEVYGPKGAPRALLRIDYSRRVIHMQTPAWESKVRTHVAGSSFIEELNFDGQPKRLMPGTSIIGQAGDRLMLVERADWSTCDDHQGGYFLLDTQTRVVLPLGDMGGFASNIYRHHQGLGFAIGRLDGDDPDVKAILLVQGVYERRSVNRLDRREPQALLTDWGINPVPLSRSDARSFDDPASHCAPSSADDLNALRPHLRRRTKLVAGQWHTCGLGPGARLLTSTSGQCGGRWELAVLDPDGGLVGSFSGKESNTFARLRRIDAQTVLIELWGSADTPHVFHATPDSLTRVSGTFGFSLRPPADCRKRCDIGFVELGPGT